MDTTATKTAAAAAGLAPLWFTKPLQRRHLNRVLAAVYTMAILSLLYHHTLKLLNSTTLLSFCISLSLFISDIILSYMWSTTQAFHMNPVNRQVFPENLEKHIDIKDFPGLDVFICTANPYIEPPIKVINTALSVMAYDYPTEKLSVYVSDDGGSELTLFAFMEAAKFGKIWVPFCKENNVMERCPHAYFTSNHVLTAQALEIKTLYEKMKIKVVTVVERGKISEEYILSEEEGKILSQYWSKDFTPPNHPSVIKVLLDSKKDRDVRGEYYWMPNLIYISREKSESTTHNFKAGALNTLLRVSAWMTNGQIVLTLDCDMYSNDPWTPKRVLCNLWAKSSRANCGYVQFPQIYHGVNNADIYAGVHQHMFHINPIGMDGLNGPCFFGTGCFFLRRAFSGGPSSETSKLSPYDPVDKPNFDEEVLRMAHHVSRCTYENNTPWGSKMGFRYGSLVEDVNTGFRLQCEGWNSIYCNPKRPAFLGDVPVTLNDALIQNKRWAIGLLEMGFSKYSPLTFGIRSMGILMGQSYAHYTFWPIWSFPITVYAFLPSLTLLNAIPIFPQLGDPWFIIYVFLFAGAYAQDYLDFILTQGTFQRWWSDQRMWLIRGLSSYLFGSMEYIAKRFGMTTHGFNVTSKVMDDEQSKRYDQEMFEFGAPSPMFVPLAMASILNLIAFLHGIEHVFKERSFDTLFIQMMIAGFGVLNALPFYEAMILRSDKGRMPTKITVTSILLAGGLHVTAFLILKT